MSVELEDVPAGSRPAVLATLERIGAGECHLAVVEVNREQMAELNREHRGMEGPTDVLSFPIDPEEGGPGPRELGDVFVCREECEDFDEAVVHGVLHLLGFDHETDQGEMLEVQAEIMEELRG